jgi:hypothetical protein
VRPSRSLPASAALALVASALAAPALAGVAGPAYAATRTTCAGQTATIVGTAGDDDLTGTGGDDVIIGLGGRDTVDGGGGHDVVCGGSGNDVLVGGDGDDVLHGGAGADRLTGGPGNDTLVGDTALEDGSDVFWGGADDDTLVYRDQVDAYFFDPGSDPAAAPPVQVDLRTGKAAGEGSDLLVRRGPSSRYARLAVHLPDDSFAQGASTDDHVVTGDGSLLRLGRGDDLADIGGSRVVGGPGIDGVWVRRTTDAPAHVWLGAGPDSVIWDGWFADGDTVRGGAGRNQSTIRLAPAPGQLAPYDVVHLDLGAGTLHEVSGATDRAVPFRGFVTAWITPDGSSGVTPAAAYELDGTDAADQLWFDHPGRHPITVRARAGNDDVVTGAGDDTVHGGPGDDRARAGSGTNTCRSVEHPHGC